MCIEQISAEQQPVRVILKYRNPLHQCRAFPSRIDKCISNRHPFCDQSSINLLGELRGSGGAVSVRFSTTRSTSASR